MKSTGPLRLQPLISVIVPVWREPDLAGRLAQLRAQAYPELEVIVVDGEAEGTTIAGLQAAWDSAQIPLTCLISPRSGRGYQLRHGAEAARGEILLFLHADTHLPEHALTYISTRLRQYPELAGGAFDLGIDSTRPVFRLIETIASWRSRLSRLPYGDQALFLHSSAYEAIGGFPAEPLMEDVGICRRLKRQGLRLGFISQRVGTSARRWEREGLLYCTLRNWLLLSLYFAGVSPARLAQAYRRQA